LGFGENLKKVFGKDVDRDRSLKFGNIFLSVEAVGRTEEGRPGIFFGEG